ncbi:hypothetical protein L207DRAFT_509500 [Hyaloscypha variabilis F]|uniref:Uncharacterized protein n=1 Tax=Hyaloscypha variabilis (strain UAMH 11265 / GT02V1 / F) TaxID=1149755 RepID=A0A2J6RWK6_HYAVF|nr:hypothetical protein L207DRAFT_509500 [Hyaloscypha variabilis F]
MSSHDDGSSIVPSQLDSLYQHLRDLEPVRKHAIGQMLAAIAQRTQLEARLQQLKTLDSSNVNTNEHPPEKPALQLTELKSKVDLWSFRKQELDDRQSALRLEINILARPTLRHLELQDMADEILFRIFGYVNTWSPCDHLGIESEHATHLSSIKSLRLTCWRFCNASSHLLIPVVQVDMRQASLERLANISSHPTISKGVRVIRVILQHYNKFFAEDLQAFIGYQTATLDRDNASCAARTAHYSQLYGVPEDELLDAIAKVDKIVSIWATLNSADQADEHVMIYKSVLDRAYQEYAFLFQQQEKLRADGTFVQSIAAAFRRMPTVQSLELCDTHLERGRLRWTHIELANDPEALRCSIVQPMHWAMTTFQNLELPLGDVLVQMPGAILEAGGMFTTLEIQVPGLQYCSILPSTASNLQSATASIQRLKSFNFRSREFMHPDVESMIEPTQLQDLEVFTCALHTNSLENISLEFHYSWRFHYLPRLPTFSLGPLISIRSWQNLKTFKCVGMPLHLTELESFVDNLTVGIDEVKFHSLYLLTGSWAAALDIMRKSVAKRTSLEDPYGAECASMEREKSMAIFDYRAAGSQYSPADQYIMRLTDCNPIRDGNDEEVEN